MNRITIELCAEDRALLTRLAEALEHNTHNCESCVQSAIKMTQAVAPAPTEEPETEPTTAEEVAPPAVTPTEEEKPAEEVKPSVTLAEIQQKVVHLCAGFEGKKKAAVREIVNAYAKKVSDLPEDKWDDVWEKLVELEAQG